MITTEIMGGLGNQLFQIFNLISYCLTNKKPFYFEIADVVREDRPFYWNVFLKSLKPFLKPKINIPICRETSFEYNALPNYNSSFKFFGYFQSYRYFIENQENIYKIIKLNDNLNIVRKKYDYDYSNTLSLHFRIGDYKHIQHNHPIMNKYYYVDAIQHIIDKTNIDTWNILYFYEEMDKSIVNETINYLKGKFNKINFISIHTDIVDYEQLLLMSNCEHNIIANSSFSWWGAYFNKNKNKIITYPSLWFGPAQSSNTKDLFPNTWNKINVIN